MNYFFFWPDFDHQFLLLLFAFAEHFLRTNWTGFSRLGDSESGHPMPKMNQELKENHFSLFVVVIHKLDSWMEWTTNSTHTFVHKCHITHIHKHTFSQVEIDAYIYMYACMYTSSYHCMGRDRIGQLKMFSK